VNVVFLVAGVTIRRRFGLIELPLVAAVAFHLPMVALQRIGGVAIVFEEQGFPMPLGMTADALFPESSFVLIIFFVATEAINRRLVFIEMPLMARFAFRPQVSAEERILGVQPVVEHDRLPVAFGMARLAFLPIASLMLVVFLVTGVAVERRIFEGRRRMAFLALDRFMLPEQREPRLIMVERRFLPRALVVALFAVRAFLSLMLVVFSVAGVAVERRVLVPVIRMAVLAGCFCMLASQGISSLVVVEPDVLPILLAVAIRAEFSHAAFVLVVFLVTRIAGGRGFSIFRFRLVARLTFHLGCVGVSSAEREVGLSMVEGFLVDGRDVLRPSLVLRVARFALFLILEPSVQALLCVDVFAHVLVTVLTEL